MGKNNKNNANTSAMKQLLPLMLAGMLAVIGSIASLYTWLNSSELQQQQQNQATMVASALAQQVNGYLVDTQHQLTLISERPDVESALINGTEASFNASPHLWLSNATLTLIPRRGNNTDALSYTAQELLKQIRLGNQPSPALIAGSPPELVIAQATKNKNGVLLLTRSLASLNTLIQASVPAGTQVTIKHGSTTLFTSTQQVTGATATATAGPISVNFTLPTPNSSLSLLAGVALGLSLVVLLGATLLVNRLLVRALRQDAAELIRYNDELARQPGVTARNRFHFPLFQTVTDAQAKSAEKLRSRNAPATTKAKPSQAVEIEESDDDGILLVDERQGESLPEEIFRAYDIRGVAGVTLTAQGAYLLGRAIGTEASEAGQQTVLVARDGRLSSPELTRSLIKGLLESGRDVINLGLVPSPVLYYATEVLETQTGVMVTGSHNPPTHNGMKIVIKGETLYGDRIQAIRTRISTGDFNEGQGREQELDINDRYLADVTNDIVLARPLKIGIDCGNGATGELAPKMFTQLGCEVSALYTEIDGNFPNHAPDPGNPENLADLIRLVDQEKLDLGLAFDGDGDRVAVVTNRGEIIWPDRLMMLFARDVLSRSPGADILFDVKCTRALPAIIRKSGGRPLMYKTGHSLIKAKMKETGAPLAGEISGHIFFADRWHGCDDGMYAGARLLEILSLLDDPASQIFSGLKTGITTPALYIEVDESQKFTLVDALSARAEQFAGGRPTTIDGLRVDFPDGWGLVRASNTTASLVARFEGRDEEALQRVKTQFRNHLKAVDESLTLPF
ncbi:phosphoglucomutase/phosphomannomutase [Alcanivorax nanhaiticus]|uniref:phosphomannomutase n=1 Tax=Alcanivorax nanhaiticus TaxID=1177154 RepID=A0A095SK04_9GAMM|nr:phosphomannomutase/phosphoglucomutase [Alcanivorax nanhaiticus]KGD64634.1 phosphoglucomutase/phosphomannomutase [Alcanivorax nanhaiticus]